VSGGPFRGRDPARVAAHPSQGLGSKRPPWSRPGDPTAATDLPASPKWGIRRAESGRLSTQRPHGGGRCPSDAPYVGNGPKWPRPHPSTDGITISGNREVRSREHPAVPDHRRRRRHHRSTAGSRCSESGRWLCRDSPTGEWRRCEHLGDRRSTQAVLGSSRVGSRGPFGCHTPIGGVGVCRARGATLVARAPA
jgi:hypothetical protein